MRPDYDLIRNAIQLALDNDPKHMSDYAAAKWHIDQLLSYRPTPLEILQDMDLGFKKLFRLELNMNVSDFLDDSYRYFEDALGLQNTLETCDTTISEQREIDKQAAWLENYLRNEDGS